MNSSMMSQTHETRTFVHKPAVKWHSAVGLLIRRARRTAPQPGCRHQRPLQSTPARDVPSSSRGHGLLWPGSTQPAGAQKCPRSRRQRRLAPSVGNASGQLWKQGGGGGRVSYTLAHGAGACIRSLLAAVAAYPNGIVRARTVV
jgi:hypothetical protein